MDSEPRLGLARHHRAVGHELRALAQERHVHVVGRAVALLGDDQLRLARLGRVRLIDDLAVDEDDDVGILFEGPALSKVRELRASAAATLFDARESCDSAMMGTPSSFAEPFKPREICEISCTRFSAGVLLRMS
jgi:hypothetical protein